MNAGGRRRRGLLVLPQTYPPDVGGVETFMGDLTKVLRQRDDLITWILAFKPIVTRISRYRAREQCGPVSIRRYWWFGGNLFRRLEPWPALLFLYITPYFLLRSFLFMLTHSRRIDVIHAHGFNMGFVAVALGAVFRKRVIFQSHALYCFREGSLSARVAAAVLRRMDAVLALCRASMEELSRLGTDRGNIRIYRHWIDLGRFTDNGRGEARARLGWGPAFTVLFVGRLIGIKGEEVVIRLAERFREAVFVVAGDGPNRAAVAAAARRLTNFRYIGLIDNADLPEYYRSADVLLAPSQYPEAFGRVICEALACGTPVIASNAGGIPDALDESVGILCGLGVEDYAVALRRLLDAPEVYRRLQSQARKHALAMFSERNAECILDAYMGK
ncbi:MAG: glycosyltransferase family 4 protein [Kiritimatiellae bacterium]|nr:glycosyltransferase family 4 protein [Kiritimatiellia bacterium]